MARRLAVLESAERSAFDDWLRIIDEEITRMERCGRLADDGVKFSAPVAGDESMVRVAEILNMARRRRNHATA